MRGKLLAQATLKMLAGLAALGILLFVPAGTLAFWKAWFFIAVLFVPMATMGMVLLVKAPALLAKRLQSKEKEPAQKNVLMLSAVMFIGGFTIAGLDFRFGWSALPDAASYVAAVIFLLGYGMFAEVMRENAYLSRVVEVQENQRVVDTGLYGLVRHPMYLATLIIFLSTPFVLGSFYAGLIFLIYPALVVKRIRGEEAVLQKDLAGYAAYMKKVKFRLLPCIW